MAYEEMKAQKKSSGSSKAKSALGSALDSLSKPKSSGARKSTGTRKSTAKSGSSKAKSGASRKKSSSSTNVALPIMAAVVGSSTKSKNTNKKEKQSSSKSGLALVLIVLFLAVGLVGGFFAAKFLCKNDVYEMVAYSNGEVDITLGEDVTNYTELGVKCVAFGKEYDNYEVSYYWRNSMTEDEEQVNAVGEKGAGIYYAVYTAPTFKYKTVKLIRNIIVLRGKMMSKAKSLLLSIFCLILGVVVGFAGNIFLTLPDSYEIPQKSESHSHSNSATAEEGAHIIEGSDLTIHFLELGNRNTGDCIYIKVKNGNTDTDILVDAGSKSTSVETIENYVDEYLTDNVLDYVIITHAHEDHYAGFATHSNTESIFDHYRTGGNSIGTIITFAQTNKKDTATMHKNYKRELGEAISSGAKHFTALECSNGATTSQGTAQNIYTLGTDSSGQEIKMFILYQKYYVEHSTTENNYSVCFQIVQGSKKYLFTGDLEAEGEESLVDSPKNAGLLSQVELYKAGHHGSKTSSSQKLMSVIQPKNVVVCCCAGSSEYTTKNENQFPTQEFVNNVAPYTDKIYVTTLCIDYNANQFESFNGNVTVCSTGTDAITVVCSNNTTVLQDTEWFDNNRTLPENHYRTKLVS